MGYLQNNLTSVIYDMALGHASWDNILDILAASLPDCLIMVSGDDLVGRKNLVFSQRGLEPSAANAYAHKFAAINPWLDGQSNIPLYQVFHDDQIVPRDVAKQSPYYKEWMSQQGDFSAGTGVVVLREGARQLTIEVRYPENTADHNRLLAASLLSEAANHFRRAFEIVKRSRFATGSGYLDSMVEDLPFTVFFVSDDMRIQYCNYQAENMRRQRDGMFTSSDGILRANGEGADELLRQLVHKTVSSKRGPTSVLQITNPADDTRYFAIARMAPRGNQPYQLHDAILDPGPLVMLVVHGGEDQTHLPTDLLWRSFSLTESEAELADALLSGDTLADFARRREVSKQTLRNQLVGVMRKTGTRRQSELVSLLTRLSLTCL